MGQTVILTIMGFTQPYRHSTIRPYARQLAYHTIFDYTNAQSSTTAVNLYAAPTHTSTTDTDIQSLWPNWLSKVYVYGPTDDYDDIVITDDIYGHTPTTQPPDNCYLYTLTINPPRRSCSAVSYPISLTIRIWPTMMLRSRA